MDAQLGDTVAHRLDIAKQTAFKSLDSKDDNAANPGVCQLAESRRELRESLDAEHGVNVIERLQTVKLDRVPDPPFDSQRAAAAAA
jgi:hypothetical protein